MKTADLQLPGIMALVFEHGGLDAVQKLAKAVGGKLFFIPSRERLTDSHILVRAAGRQVAEQLCETYPRVWVEFPRAQAQLRLALAAALLAKQPTISANKLSDKLGTTYRHARRIRDIIRGKGRQARALAELFPPVKQPVQVDLEEFLSAPPSTPRHR